MNGPILTIRLIDHHPVSAEIDLQASIVNVEIKKIAFNHLTFITQGNKKLLIIIVGIMLQDVPQDRLSPYFNHRFRADLGLFGEASAQASRKDDCFHRLKSFSAAVLLPTCE